MERYRGLTASGRDRLGKRVGIKGAPEARRWEHVARMLLPSPHDRTPPLRG